MTPQEIRIFVPKISSNLDLLTLLNKVKRDIYGNKCHDFSLKLVTYYCNPSRAIKAYKKFRIPKKSGGAREIAAPQKSLLAIQECLNVVFQALYTPSAIATGFLPGKSVVDNARKHTGMNYVFNTDIKDFFPSINQARVWKLLQMKQYGFKTEIANVVAGLCCMQVIKKNPETGELVKSYVLPQGSPASPILTNMICQKLDRRLNGLAKRFNLNCSRYADDITFSSSHNVYAKDGEFRKELKRIIEDQNFQMNDPKTRLQRKNERQEVTGVVISDKINVNRQYVRDIQSVLYIWERYGYDIAFARFSAHYRENKPQNHMGGDGFMANVIKGKLMYMKMVKGEDDPVYNRLLARLNALCPPKDSKTMTSAPCELAYTIDEFEQQYETALEFQMADEKAKEQGRLFATSRFNGKNIYIIISKKCLEPLKNALESGETTELDALRKKYFMVMKRRKSGKTYWMIMNANPKMVQAKIQTGFSLSELEEDAFISSDQNDTTQAESPVDIDNTIDAVLSNFVGSNYDLSILEQWDKTRNS